MNKKGDMNKVLLTMFILALVIVIILGFFPKTFNNSAKQFTNHAKQIDMNGNGLPYEVELHMKGHCPCDKDSDPKYYYFKETTYKQPSEWSDDVLDGYLLGYFNGKQIDSKKIIDNPVSSLRLSENDLDLIEWELSNNNPDLQQLLSKMGFEEIDFTSTARLGQLCVPELSKGVPCTYNLFVKQLLENEEGVPVLGCKTTPESCKLKYEQALEKSTS